jgi:diamine N-acetyltransferase
MATMQMQLVPTPEHREIDTRYDVAGDPFGVRRFHESDRADLEDFYDGFHPQRAAQGLPPTGRVRIGRWLRHVLPRGVQLTAWRGDTLIGHALVVPTDRPGVGEYAVFLHQSQRGRGVGTELTRAAIESAREAGFASLWLTVEPGNRPAVRAYERVGFRFRPATTFSSEAEMTLNLRSQA